MGLDSVELVMEVEDFFDITIPDGDAERITTPGEFVDYLLSRLPQGPPTACWSQRAFYRVRDAAVRVLGQPRSAIEPATRWEEILPTTRREATWRLLGVVAGAPAWPSLTRRGLLPKGTSTVGETARHLASQAPRRPIGGWTKANVQEAIRMIVTRQLGITDFRWTDRFVDDLGVD